MASGKFESADIGKIDIFEKQSQEAITEFEAIKKEFAKINTTLLKKWKGTGADSYKKETDHILENIGSVKDVLDSINNGMVKDIKDNYVSLDKELEAFNKDPKTEEEEGDEAAVAAPIPPSAVGGGVR